MTPNPEISSDVPPKPGDASERRTSGWDIRNAPRNYLSLVAYQAGSALFSFGAVWIITHYLGSEGYGGIVAVIAASQVAQVLVNWTNIGVVRFGVDEFIETGKIARTFWLRFLILAVNLILVGSLSPFWFPLLADWLKLPPQTFWLVMGHFAVTAFWLHVQMSLQGAKLLRIQGLLQTVERMLILAGLVGLTAGTQLTESMAMICYILAPGATMLVAVFLLRTYVLARFTVDAAFVRKFIAFSVPLLPFSVVGYFSGSYLDAIFVAKFLSTRDLGIYSVATQVSGIVMQAPTLANTLLLPLFVTLQRESDGQRAVNYFSNVIPTLTLFWGLACTVLGFFGYFAVPFIFGGEFQPAAMPLWILLAAAGIGLPAWLGYSAFSNAASTTYIPMTAALFSSTVNIAANFILIPRYGLIGCAVATAASYFVSVAMFSLLVRRTASIPLSWTYVAFVPCIAGAASAYGFGRAWIGLAVCILASFLIGSLYKESLRKTFAFLKTFRAA